MKPAHRGFPFPKLTSGLITYSLILLLCSPFSVTGRVGKAIPEAIVLSPSASQAVAYREGEVLVKFRGGSSQQEREMVVASHGMRRKRQLRGESAVDHLELLGGQNAAVAAIQLLSSPHVEFAEPNYFISKDQITPSDPRFGEQWALRNTGQAGGPFGTDIKASGAWEMTVGSPSTVIAVIDSGIDFSHPDLSNNRWVNPLPGPNGDLNGWDFVDDDSTIEDEQGHGTAIAGIIGARGNNELGVSGVMWRASLMNLRVLDNTGTGDIANAVEAIDYAISRHAQVINISWGTNGESLALKQAIQRAIARGVVVVCSAGNGGQDLHDSAYYPASFGLRDLIVVAATDHNDRLPSWSNWGHALVTVAAPGTNVLTTKMGGSYWSVTGTSAAAPLVAGVAGLMKTLRPGETPRQIAKLIERQARQVASLSGKISSGGVLDAVASLNALRGSSHRPNRPIPGYGTGGNGPGGSFDTTPPEVSSTLPGSGNYHPDQIKLHQPKVPSARTPIQGNLMCADCDPQSGGGGGGYYPYNDPNFSSARELPGNETGQTGVDLGSRNFNWRMPLVSLTGRAGLDLNLSLTYNSLVWTKDGSYIKYNADLGSPAPGFRLGLPILQQRFFNSQTGIYAYMMVMPSGARVEMRQISTSNIYESQDGSYTQLDVSNASTPLVRTTDGTQFSFVSVNINGEYRCSQIKDRNGNFITATYNPTNGHLLTITDTVGRVISFLYDANNNLERIRQTWAGASHDWATFTYGDVYVAPNFGGGLIVNGPNNNYVTVLTQLSLHDGSYVNFSYNAAFGQVNRITHYAPNGAQLAYTSYNLDSSAGQLDCPRFTERRDWATHWNNDQEALTAYSVAGDGSWSQQTAPDGTIYKEFFAIAGWQRGLTTSSEIWSGGARKKWTSIVWTQDDTNLGYQKNPRVTETSINDPSNHKRTTVSYGPYASYSLPYEVIEYANDGATMLRRTYTDYNLSSAYLERRIIGLVSVIHVVEHASNTYVSKTSFDYDYGAEYMSSQSAVQHDASGYGAGLVAGRGNLTGVVKWDVTDINNGAKAIAQTRSGYNTTGALVFSRDALNHQTTISYADSYSDGNNTRSTFAYPTTVTDADNFSSTAQYNFDHGAITLTTDPKGASISYEYDAARRTTKIKNLFNNAYKRWVYADGQDYTLMFETLNDTQEFYSFTWNDGAGRIHGAGGDLPNSVGGFFVGKTVFNIMGRAIQSTNPTEITGAIIPTGDDSAFVWTSQTFDWKGRPLITTNADGSTREMSYGGCGCAGGETSTVRDERGRRRTLTKDVLGRLKQVDELNWNQSVYATSTYTYNSRDQITSSSQAGQIRTFNYDGYGRLTLKTTPEQGSTSYGYYADDTMQSVTDARGAKTNFYYNNRHLMTLVTHETNQAPDVSPTNQSAFSYDAAGNRTNMTTWYLGTVNYQYDTLSRMTSETRYFDNVGSFTINYTYNLSGQLTSITNPWSAAVGYNYDKAGRPNQISGSGYAGVSNYAPSLAYRAFGLKGMSYGDGKTLSLKYDNRMRMTEWHVPTVMRWDYSYTNFGENTGRVTYMKNLDDGTLDRSFDYDHLGRLGFSHSGREARWHIGSDTWAIDGPYSHHYGYDQFGNRTHREGWGGIYGAGVNDHPTYVDNRQVGLTYDAAGNVTNDGSQTYSYDATGQQTYASSTALTQSYDGDRLRVKKVENGLTSYFLRSTVLGGQVVAELNSSGAWTRGYVYLGGQLVALQGGSGGQVSWIHQNPGSKSQRITNGSGTVISTVELDPWGGETARSSNQAFQPHRYTTYTRDGNAGDEAMMRRYQANFSRFSQPDPYDGAYNITDPQSLNRYAYVQNDPVNFVDPSGLMPCIETIDAATGQLTCVGGPSAAVTVYVTWADRIMESRGANQGVYYGSLPMITMRPLILQQNPRAQQVDPCLAIIAQFPASGQGYYTYDNAHERYGQGEVVSTLVNFASNWNQNHPNNPIGVGDISLRGGGNIRGHGEHEQGLQVDIRPMRNDNVNGPTNFRSGTYSFDLTNALVQGLLGLNNVATIRFNDPNIQGTIRDRIRYDANGRRLDGVHDNHLHVTFASSAPCP